MQGNVSMDSASQHKTSQVSEQGVNPMDISINDMELEKDNWVCASGVFDPEKEGIVCTVPEIVDYDSNNLMFNVDIALNG